MKVVDMHCDTISEIWQKRKEGSKVCLLENDMHVDLLRMKESGYLLQNFALFVDGKDCGDPWEQVNILYRVYTEELEQNRDVIAPVLKFADIRENESAGKLSALLTVEEGAVCKGELQKLRQLYDMGVRMLTLTWNYPNELGHPNLDSTNKKDPVADKAALADFLYVPNTKDGLTERGREFVAEMERLGMIVDVSHLSDAGFYDVLACTKKPFVASHSNARAVCRCVRNLTDDMIRRLAERGGCMGLNFCADFLEEAPTGQENPGTVEAVVRHARHIVKQGGVEVLGLGSDFDGIATHRELQGAQSMERLWEALHKGGFTQAELDKIFCENVLRVYRECLV